MLFFDFVALADDVSLPDSFQVVFSAGESTPTKCITIPIARDEEIEGNHNFTISISSAGTVPYAVVGSPAVATVIIIDDDADMNEGISL